MRFTSVALVFHIASGLLSVDETVVQFLGKNTSVFRGVSTEDRKKLSGFIRGIETVLSTEDQDALAAVRETLTGSIGAYLSTSHSEDKARIASALKTLQGCDKPVEEAMGPGGNVREYYTLSVDTSEKHLLCRGQHSRLFEEHTVAAAQYRGATISIEAPPPPPTPEWGTDLEAIREFFSETSAFFEWFTETHARLSHHQSVTTAAKNKSEEKSLECNNAQDQYEQSFANYAHLSNNTCHTYQTCRELTVGEFKETLGLVRTDMASRRALNRSLDLILCHVSVVEKIELPNQDHALHHQECEEHIDDNDRSGWDISLPDQPAELPCPSNELILDVSSLPCDESWDYPDVQENVRKLARDHAKSKCVPANPAHPKMNARCDKGMVSLVWGPCLDVDSYSDELKSKCADVDWSNWQGIRQWPRENFFRQFEIDHANGTILALWSGRMFRLKIPTSGFAEILSEEVLGPEDIEGFALDHKRGSIIYTDPGCDTLPGREEGYIGVVERQTDGTRRARFSTCGKYDDKVSQEMAEANENPDKWYDPVDKSSLLFDFSGARAFTFDEETGDLYVADHSKGVDKYRNVIWKIDGTTGLAKRHAGKFLAKSKRPDKTGGPDEGIGGPAVDATGFDIRFMQVHPETKELYFNSYPCGFFKVDKDGNLQKVTHQAINDCLHSGFVYHKKERQWIHTSKDKILYENGTVIVSSDHPYESGGQNSQAWTDWRDQTNHRCLPGEAAGFKTLEEDAMSLAVDETSNQLFFNNKYDGALFVVKL